MRFRPLALAVLAFSLLPVSALAADDLTSSTVTDVRFSSDQDVATVTLSQALTYSTIRFDLYVNGVVRRNGTVPADGATTVSMSGFRQLFVQEGESQYLLGFQICEHGADRQNIDAHCSPRKFITLLFFGASSSSRSSSSSSSSLSSFSSSSSSRSSSSSWSSSSSSWSSSSASSVAYSFVDVGATHPNADAIAYVKDRGIVSGYPDGTYRPGQAINRAEFTKIIVNAQFSPTEISECLMGHGGALSFLWDISSTAWYAQYVCVAFNHGIIRGYPDGSFRPEQTINLAEAAKILSVSLIGADGSSDPWFRVYLQALADRRAIPTSFYSYDQLVSRGEMAEMIYRLKTDNRDRPSQTYESLAGAGHPAAPSGWTDYRQDSLGWTLRYPGAWVAGEFTTGDERGVAFVNDKANLGGAGGGGIDTQNHLRIGLRPSCPDLTVMAQGSENVRFLTIGDRTFQYASTSDGAAGSTREYTVFTSPRAGGGCYVITKNMFYGNPDNYGEPDRSNLRRAIADVSSVLDQSLQSFRAP